MITTGIIKQVNLSSDNYNSNLYQVELPIFKSAADSLSSAVIIDATACLPGGIYDCYSTGDYVYVGFINNKFNYPVILGKIYKGIQDNYCGSFDLQQLKVLNQVKLPTETQIGDINYSDIQRAVIYADNQRDILNFQSDINPLNDHNDVYFTKPKNIGTWVTGNNLNRITYIWLTNIEADTNFSKNIKVPDEALDFWCDLSYSYIDNIGQPFYKSSTNNFNLEINKDSREVKISGKVQKPFSKVYITTLFTS